MLKRLFSSTKRPYIPGINKPETFSMDLSGNSLSFLLPPHHNFHGFEERADHVLAPNIYDVSAYHDDPYGLFSHRVLLSRRMEIFGVPWDTQPIGSITTGVLIYHAENLPDGLSCLNPPQFEQIITRFLFQHGPENPQYGVRVAPVNWQVYKNHDTPWIYCEERDKNPKDEVAWYGFAFAPLDDSLFVLVNFSCLNSDRKEIINEHLRAMMSRITSTLDLKYRPEIQAKILRLQSKAARCSYTEQREPEDWVYPWAWYRGSREHGQPPVVIKEWETPPPEYKI